MGDIAIFPAEATTGNRVITIPNGNPIIVGEIIISDDDVITIQGGTGTLGLVDNDTNVYITASGAGHVIASRITIEDNLLIFSSPSDPLQFTGGIDEANNGQYNVTIGGFVRFAAHNLDNSYSGETRVLYGTLELAHTGGAYSIPGDLVIGSAADSIVRLIEDGQIVPSRTPTRWNRSTWTSRRGSSAWAASRRRSSRAVARCGWPRPARTRGRRPYTAADCWWPVRLRAQ